jgi:hypothetical protein
MQSTSFIALTGHLNEYPLADLISILRHQRKTGRLLIEYSISPCSLYFVEGDVVDAQLGSMSGMQAVLVALSQPNASFNFNPLIQPPRRSIDEASQKVVLELLGCWEEKAVDIEAVPRNGGAFSVASKAQALPIEVEMEALPGGREVLALPPSGVEVAGRRRNRRVLIASAIISLVVSLITVAAVTRWLIRRDITAAVSEMNKKQNAGGAQSEITGTNAQTIKVAVRVEKGRVTQAFVEKHRPGLEAYEALALRIARTRRYAPEASGQATVPVRINSPD